MVDPRLQWLMEQAKAIEDELTASHESTKKMPRLMKGQPRDWHDTLQAGAMGTSFIPGIGDVVGLAADADMYANEPESRNMLNYILTAAGALPFVPAASVARKATGQVPEKIKAYHGSPHDFDKFSMENIGIGEGAQAYGHGLYFAESEDVARGYREALSDRGKAVVRGGDTEMEIPPWLSDKIAAEGGIDGSIAEWESRVAEMRQKLADPSTIQPWIIEGNISRMEKELEAMRKIQQSGVDETFKGRMYQVEIDATPDELLDWDKPLSEQSEKVRKAIEGTGFKPSRDVSGAEAYNAAGFGAKDVATESLRKAGIKGIKYKDGFSRGAEGGTSNYVIFDDRLISISKKYGLAIPAAAAMLARQTGDDPESMYKEA